MSERARELLAGAYRVHGHFEYADILLNKPLVGEDYIAAYAIEQTLTQQRDTTPQPSADAVRELVRRAYEVVHHDDECPAIGGCGDKDCRCDAVPFLRELESLLSGGSHA